LLNIDLPSAENRKLRALGRALIFLQQYRLAMPFLAAL